MAFVTEVEATNGDVEVVGKVGSSLYGVCSSSANVVAKTADVPGLDKLVNGLTIHILFVNGNSAQNPTLTITSASPNAIPVFLHGTQPPGNGDRESWYPNSVVSMTYLYDEGSNPQERWMLNDWQSDTTYGNATSNAAGLMSAADKANLDNVVANRTTSLAFTANTSVWSQNGTYSSYPYRASITDSRITANHFAEVSFNPQHALSYIPAPVCETYDGGIYVWMMINPGAALPVSVFAVLPDRS